MTYTLPFPRELEDCSLADAIQTGLEREVMVQAEKSGRGQARVLPDVSAARSAELATMRYPEFLETEEWEDTRKAIRRRDEGCHFCHVRSGRRLDVHHLTYERRGREIHDDLVLVCVSCHYPMHRNRKT